MSEVELNFFKEVMEKYKTDKDILKKINYTVEMYNNLTIARVNNLVEKFSGVNYNNECFWRNFPSEKRGGNYAIDIYIYNDKSLLYLFSREEMQDKLEQDNKYIKAWLEKHNLFKGFEKCDDIWHGWAKEFKFPEEENALYEFTKKLIKLLEEDIESIYSGK